MQKRAGILAVAVIAVSASDCSVEGDYRLNLVFPSDEARQATDRVEVWALDPGGGTCPELIAGSIRPADMTEYARLVIRMSDTEDAGKLRGVPSGAVLFFAEGRTADGATLLRGCERVEVKGVKNLVVAIPLQVVCWPKPEGEIPQNGIDDDCDGLTDECTKNSDCNDGNGCTADFCVAESCQYTNLDGINCNDNNPCTTNDFCNDGVCRGTERDCRDFDGQCVVGACNPVTVECEAISRQNGTWCDDGLFCTVNDTCTDGICNGATRNCDDQEPCTRDRCDEGTDKCLHILEPKPMAEGPEGDATCQDNVDNDCDGFTDNLDPNCRPCILASECEDHNPCSTDDCRDGQCLNQPVLNGTECDDGFFCTVNDQCQDGVCISSNRDCSALAGPCHLGICLEAEERCVAFSEADATPCEDGLYCTVGDRCVSSVCMPLGTRVCDDSDFCTMDSCDEELDRCVFVLAPRPGHEGPPGDNSCSNGQDDDCDGLVDVADGNCYECRQNEDCDDHNDCTVDVCAGVLCANTAAAPGTKCDDGDPCTMEDTCMGDYCTGVPLDADADGFVSAACGGTDCDDSAAEAHPGLFEGPDGDASCSDSLDNDCDGKTDEYDTLCWARVCSSSGWCWENPLPQGNSLNDIWGFGPNDVWMVGWHGTILHWDGMTLSAANWAGTEKILYGIWGSAPNNVWTVGSEGFLARYNGTTWSASSAGTGNWLYAVWGFSSNDLWIGEAAGYAGHYDGSGWTHTATGTGSRLLGLWGPDPDHLWAVGWNGSIRFRTGGAWSGQTSGTSEYINSVWGASADDVWAVGNAGTVIHRQAGSWSKVDIGLDVEMFDLWGTAPDDIWAVGANDTILHFNGNYWLPAGPPATRSVYWVSTGDLRAVWGSAKNDVWVTGYGGTVLRYDGTRWTSLTEGHRGELNGVWAWSPSEAWAVGDGCAILHRDATTRTWKSQPVSECIENLFDIGGTAPNNIWAVGWNGLILKYDGSTWERMASVTGAKLKGVWALSTQEAWAVGGSGVILHYLNDHWEMVDSGVQTDLNGVWALSTNVVVAVGDGGVILHWNGSGWSGKASGTTENLYAVWGSAEDDIWTVGRAPPDGNGTLLHYNGSAWSSVDIGVADTLTGIWGSASGGVWVLGLGGVLAHLEGSSWSIVSSGNGSRMIDIWGSADGSIWIVGGSGNILHYSR